MGKRGIRNTSQKGALLLKTSTGMTRLAPYVIVLAGVLLLGASHAVSPAAPAQSGRLAETGRIGGGAYNRDSGLTLVASAEAEAQWRRPGRSSSEAPSREQPAIKSAKVAFSSRHTLHVAS